MAATSVTIRMYTVGFGDSFLVTVANDRTTWRMLVDCGVHAHGRPRIDGSSREIGETVDTIVSDLLEAAPEGAPPRVDVIVATHRHADHVSGFAEDAWSQVDVGEVWVSFVEDPDDPDAVSLRTEQDESAAAIARATRALAASGRPGSDSSFRAVAEDFAMNAVFEGPNLAAMTRLLGGDGTGFANTPTVRFLPDRNPIRNRIATSVPGATVSVLGPSRDPADLKRMNPPKKDHWLAYADDLDPTVTSAPRPLFAQPYIVDERDIATVIPEGLLEAAKKTRLDYLGSEVDALLAAAAVLERSVNNTSVFFVLDVNGRRLLFVGDSQEGAWRHVLDDPHARAELDHLLFYKIGHHGSHNATPRRFVEEVLDSRREPLYAMLPWGSVKAWDDTIPEPDLITALAGKSAHIVRADDVIDDDAVTSDPGGRWTQVSFTIPER
ncbi:hypothetical protein [Agromyces bauzanensis]|uniref:MBL fold metallo-hydrolase n=1 Tax=Agromyces bauzanensis TaxID=1308924 RepID=A0A917PS07_9MICO|nr:hypothetical protein [Agromyces bauzanensis]GGJ89024.1 hypothetical protein GCM10011372_29520 [Agromyces bauzanensis]